MGGRTSRQQSYGNLDLNPQFEHDIYFKAKSAAPVLLALIVPPEDSGTIESAQARLIILTNTSLEYHYLRTGQMQKQLSKTVVAASMSVASSGKKTFTYADAANIVYIIETTNLNTQKVVQFEDNVTALKMLSDGYLVIGGKSGKICMVNTEDLQISEVVGGSSQPVSVFAHSKTLQHNSILVGYQSGQDSNIFRFNHVTLASPHTNTYQPLPGSCADISVIESEKLVLALCERSSELHIWDLENTNFLLVLDLHQEALSKFLAFESFTNSLIELVLGCSGVVVGQLQVSDDTVSWTPKRKSELPAKTKVKPGRASSLDYDRTMDLLIYGDDKGQVWLLRGPTSTIQQGEAVVAT